MAATTLTVERSPARRRLRRCLDRLVDVRPGEGWAVLLLAADIFCLLSSYYLLKTARESLILSEGSAEVKSYAAGAQALILLAVVPLYGAVASRVSRTHLINGVLVFFVSHLAVFHALASRGVHVGVPFFLWVGVFNLMIVAQFWAFANDVYTIERGQRLFPLVGVGGSLGAWFGARAASMLMAARVSPSGLFVLAGLGLLACVGFNLGVVRQTRSPGAIGAPRDAETPLGSEGGLELIVSDPYLRLIAILVILVNVVNTTGEYLLGRLVVANAVHAVANGTAGGFSKAQLIGMFYGDFFAWVNLTSFAMQLLVVPRVFRRVGVSGGLLVLPLIACGTYGLFAFLPVLSAVRVGKIVENATDYSLQNTARHALFLSTSREAKFKAKQAIDGLCCRVGDVLQAGLVLLGTHLGFGTRPFALINEVGVGLWVVVVVKIYRAHKRRGFTTNSERAAA